MSYPGALDQRLRTDVARQEMLMGGVGKTNEVIRQELKMTSAMEKDIGWDGMNVSAGCEVRQHLFPTNTSHMSQTADLRIGQSSGWTETIPGGGMGFAAGFSSEADTARIAKIDYECDDILSEAMKGYHATVKRKVVRKVEGGGGGQMIQQQQMQPMGMVMMQPMGGFGGGYGGGYAEETETIEEEEDESSEFYASLRLRLRDMAERFKRELSEKTRIMSMLEVKLTMLQAKLGEGNAGTTVLIEEIMILKKRIELLERDLRTMVAKRAELEIRVFELQAKCEGNRDFDSYVSDFKSAVDIQSGQVKLIQSMISELNIEIVGMESKIKIQSFGLSEVKKDKLNIGNLKTEITKLVKEKMEATFQYTEFDRTRKLELEELEREMKMKEELLRVEFESDTHKLKSEIEALRFSSESQSTTVSAHMSTKNYFASKSQGVGVKLEAKVQANMLELKGLKVSFDERQAETNSLTLQNRRLKEIICKQQVQAVTQQTDMLTVYQQCQEYNESRVWEQGGGSYDYSETIEIKEKELQGKDQELTRIQYDLSIAEKENLELMTKMRNMEQITKMSITSITAGGDAQVVLQDVIAKKDQLIQRLESKIRSLRLEFQDSAQISMIISPSKLRECSVCTSWGPEQKPDEFEKDLWEKVLQKGSMLPMMGTSLDLKGLGTPISVKIRGAMTYEFCFGSGAAVTIYHPYGKERYELIDIATAHKS